MTQWGSYVWNESSVCAMVRQTTGDNCRQLQSKSKLQRQCCQTAGVQMSQWWSSRSVEQEPVSLTLGRSWSACVLAWNPQDKHRPPTPCVSPSVPPDQSIHSWAATQKPVQTALSLLRISVWRINLSWKLRLVLTSESTFLNVLSKL